MKKLSSESSNWEIIGTINDLIDEVMALDKVITRDIVRIATDEIIEELSEDTHRTVTLRIPKGMTFVEALFYADLSLNMSDNQAKKALDEVQPNE